MSLSPRPSGPVTLSGAPVGEPEGSSTLGLAEPERYREGALLGRGGMGEVRTVRDQRLDRDVARKVLTGHDPHGEARLAREARITARLEHPGIVPVYDAGRTEDGRPWYTMRVIRGRDLAQALADAPEPVARAALLRHFLDAAEAVGFAHSLHVVHRDLKPANILVGAFGETQVADWGLAKELRQPVDDAPGAEEEVVGTPAYMSPEQARGEPATPRSDVWSLGAILFEILTGSPLWRGSDSAVVHRLLTERPTPVLAARPDAPAELAAIAERALAADPAERYSTATALARDLALWFDGRPVSAYEYTAAELLWRAIHAWRAPLGFATVAGGIGLVLAAVAWDQTAHERDRARAAEADTRQALAVADHNLALLMVDRAREALDRADRPTSERLAAEALAYGPSAEAMGILAAWSASPRPTVLRRRPLGPCDRIVADPTGEVLLCPGPDGIALHQGDRITRLSGTAAGLVWTGTHVFATHVDGPATWTTDDRTVHASVPFNGLPTALAIPGSDAVIALGNGHFAVLEPNDGVAVHHPCGHAAPTIAAAASPAQVYTACDDGRLLLGSLEDPAATVLLDDPALRAASLGVHQGRAVLGTLEGELLLVDPDAGVLHRVRHGQLPVRDAAVDPSGRRVVLTSARGETALLDLRTGAVLTTFPGAATLARWPDAHTVRRVGASVVDWAIPDGLRPVHFPGPEGVSALDLTADRAAIAHGDGTVMVWDLHTGRPLPPLRWQEGVAKAVAWSPDGQTLAGVGQQDPGVHLFHQDGAPGPVLEARRLRRLVWTADGLLGLPFSGPTLLSWAQPLAEAAPTELGEGHWRDLDAGPGGGRVGVDREGRLFALDPGGAPHAIHLDPRSVEVVAASGSLVAMGLPDGVLLLGPAGEPAGQVRGCGTPVDLALSPDGRRLAVGAEDGRLTVWDTADPSTPLLDLRAHQEQISAVRFGPDGLLLTGSWDRTARLWDLSVLDRPATALRREIAEAWGPG